jgi:hypothetical protein
MPDVAGQSSNAKKLKFSTEKRVGRISDGHSPFAFLGD